MCRYLVLKINVNLLCRTYAQFEEGFGDVDGEHWLGLRHQNAMTAGKTCTLKVSILIDTDSESNVNGGPCSDVASHADCDDTVGCINKF